MNLRFWRKKKKSEQTLRFNEDCCLNLNELTNNEFEYLIFRFSESIKSFAYLSIEQNSRKALNQISAEIRGDTRIYFTFNWGVVGNDLLMWLGEFRRNQKAKEMWS